MITAERMGDGSIEYDKTRLKTSGFWLGIVQKSFKRLAIIVYRPFINLLGFFETKEFVHQC